MLRIVAYSCVLALHVALAHGAATEPVEPMGTRTPLPCAAGIAASLPWTDCEAQVEPLYGPLPTTAVEFKTADANTQALFDHAETCEAGNTKEFAPGFTVLVEGGGYGY